MDNIVPKAKEAKPSLDRIAKVLIPIAMFVGGMAFNGIGFIASLATKPYVDLNVDQLRKYTDVKAAEVLKDAFEHSDANRQVTMLKIESSNSELKSELSSVAAKQDILISLLSGVSKKK